MLAGIADMVRSDPQRSSGREFQRCGLQLYPSADNW